MAQYVKLPDNSLFPVAEGEDYAAAMRAAYAKYPEAFGETSTKAAPESGFIPAVKAGFSGLKSDIAALAGRSGIMDLSAAEKYRAEQEQYQKETFKPTETWGEAPFTKFKELAGGSLPYMAAPLAAAALPVLAAPAAAAGTAATIGGIAATTIGAGLAGATSAAQITGSGLSRQVQEGAKLGETELGSAVAAAIPAAALDMVSFKMMPGIRQLFAAAGKEVSEQGARKIAEQGIKETLKDYGAATVRGMGVEGITETGQQVLERLQAGLSLTDEKARDEYLESFIGGAVLGGAIAPIGRRFERGSEASAQQKEAALEKRAATEEAQRTAKLAADADKEFKQSVPYALQVEQEYTAAEQAKAALKAQIRPITKGSPTETADKAFNTNIYNQIKDQTPELRRLGTEYSRLEPVLTQAKEAQRVAGMTPEDFMLDQMAQQEGMPARGRTARLAALNTPIEPNEAAPTPEAAYAADRLALAREQTAITGDIAQDASDYVAYLMTDPAMAQAIVDNQTLLPNFTRKEQNVVRGALKLQLDAREKQRVAAGQAGTIAGQARIGTVEEEEAAAIEAQRAADEAEAARLSAERADTERQIRLAPEVEGIQRLGKAPEGAWSTARADQLFRGLYQKQMDENQVDQLLATLPMSTVSTPGRIYTGLGFDTANRRDLQTLVALARETGNKEAQRDAEAKIAELDAKPPELKNVASRLPGEGTLPEAEKVNARAEQLADDQSQTLQEFVRSLENLRRGVIPGTLRLDRAAPTTAADEFKSQFATQHLDELNTRLASFGLDPLSKTDAAKAKGRALRALNELQARWTQSKDTNAPVGMREFGAPIQAVQVLQEQIRKGLFNTINEVADKFNAQQTKGRDERMGTRPGLQYKNISGAPIEVPRAEQGARVGAPAELTLGQPRVSSDPAKAALATIGRVLDTAVRGGQTAVPVAAGAAPAKVTSLADIKRLSETGPETVRTEPINPAHIELLTRLRDALPDIKDPDFIALAQEQALRIAEGRAPDSEAVRELNGMLRAKEDAGLSTTRPGATAEELQRTSAQPQMELPGMEAPATITQRATPSNFQKMLDSKDVQGMRAAIVKKAEDAVRLMQEAAASTPRALRLARLAEARAKQEAALTEAQRLAPESLAVRKADAQARTEAEQAVAGLQQLVDNIERTQADIAVLKTVLAKEPENMAVLIGAPRLLSQEKGLPQRLTAAKAALEEGKALLASIRPSAAPVVAQAKAAEERLTETKKELGAAQKDIEAKRYEEAPPVTRETRAQDEFREAAQRGREGLNLPGIRRLVDTTKMNQQIANIRSAMGSFDAQLETEKDTTKKAEIQAKRDKAAEALETVYADAPRITTEIKERDQQTFEAAFDDAQINAYDKMAAKRRIRGGEYGTALANRRQGAVVKKGSLTVQTGEKRATPATEMAGSALERVAQERAALAELEAREKFLRDNGKAKSGGRLTEAFKALQAKTEKQRALVRKFEAAQQATVSAVRDVNKEERAAKAKPGYGGGEYKFSRGTPVKGLTTTALRDELRRAVGDEDTYAKRVSVFESVQEFLDANSKYEGEIPFDAKAFVDPDTNRAYLFAENIAKGEGLAILLHEVGVHLGFRNFFNAAQFNAIAKTVSNWATAPANTLEGKIGRAAKKRAEAAGTSAEHMNDELIAYAVEEAVKAGVEPAGTKGGSAVANWLRMVVDAFKNALVKFGLTPEKMTVGDLVNMAYGAAQIELKGTWHGTGAAFKEFDHTYMGSGEGAQAFSWGTYRAEMQGVAKVYQELGAKKQLSAWLKSPEIRAWAESQRPTFDGYTADAFKNFAQTGKKGQELAGVPFEMADTMARALDKYERELVEDPDAYSSPYTALERHLRHAQPVGSTERKDAKTWAAKANLVKVSAPNPNPLYKGLQSWETDGAARDLLRKLDYPDVWEIDTSVPFSVQVKNLVQDTKKDYEDTIAYTGNSQYFKDRAKEAGPLLAELNTLDLKDFSFNPPKAPPTPRPTGVMLRTLHGRKESEYLQWDVPQTEQPETVQKAFDAALKSLTKEQRHLYDVVLSPLTDKKRALFGRDAYSALGAALESDRAASELLHEHGVAGTKFLDRTSRKNPITNESTYNYVDYADKEEAAAVIASALEPIGPAEGLLFSRKEKGEENALTSLTDTLVAKPKTFKERVGNNFGLEFEMQTTDMRAGLREALKAGAAEMGDDTRFTQAMYSVIKADQRMPLVQSALMNGALELYTDEKGLHGVRNSNKNSAKDVFEAIADIPGRNAEEKVNLFTTYMAVQRAVNKGLTRLDAGGLGITPEAVEAAMAVVDADPALKKALDSARSAYNAFNKGMIEFVASTGAIPKAVAKTLLKDGDYVPFYRVDDNGMADLVFSDEVTINIGDIRHQPYLAQLKGGETKILPLNESLPRNTLLLMDLALTNMAAKNVAYAMQAVGEGRGAPDKSGKPTDLMSIRKGQAPAGPNIVKFSQEPDPKDPKDNGRRWLRVETAGTAMEGIPSELVVKSLEGAHLTLPAFLKLGGMAGDWLRAGVTRMPMYLARQLIRDPMAAAFTGGLNYGPLRAVAKAGKEFIALSRGTSETGAKLVEKGLIQSGIFTGDPSDLSKIALQLSSGKDQGVVNRLFAMLDRAAMRADAATRTQIYDNAIANGLSEVEADMMVMESMNFYKRGLSPTVQYASRLIPFFNAQIQGLNVLYKAARGQMPFEEQQQIQRKFFNNALLLVGMGVVYAMAMEDDPYFKNAKPRDKYSNFFLPIPGVEEPFKLPIPYEAGWFFSLAVAAVDAMKKETDTPQQFKALRDMFLSSVPGYSSAGMPQLVKPVFEVWTNKNFFSGQNIESARLENLAPQERFKASTSEAAKALSKALPMLSPIQIEHLAGGYFGQLPLIIAGATDSLFRKTEAGTTPEKRTTDLPFIGQAFQKKYGGADTDVVYREAGTAIEAKATFEKMRKEGRAAEAKEFLADNRAEVASAGLAQNFRKMMGRLRDDESRITNMPSMSAKEKRARIDKLDEARQDIAQKYEVALKRIEQGVGGTTPR